MDLEILKKHYKQNTINDDLHYSKKVSSNFDEDMLMIKDKLIKADYPLRFIISELMSFKRVKIIEMKV